MPKIVYKIFEYSYDENNDNKLYRRENVFEGKDHPLNEDFNSVEDAMAALVLHCGESEWVYHFYDIVIQVRI